MHLLASLAKLIRDSKYTRLVLENDITDYIAQCQKCKAQRHMKYPMSLQLTGHDQRKEFTAELFQKICKLLEIDKLLSTAHYYESIGESENSHKHINNYLQVKCGENGK